MKLFRVPVIKKKGPRQRKHDGVDYLVMAKSRETAREKVADYLAEYDVPLRVGLGQEMNEEGGPIPWIYYSLDPSEVEIRMKRDPVEAEGLTGATRDPDFSDEPR